MLRTGRKISQVVGHSACLLSSVLVMLSFVLHARSIPDVTKLGAEALKAYDLLDGATSDLLNVQKVVADIESGKKPTIPSNHWDTLSERYQSAARILKNAPMPTDFDKSKYAFSPQELANCGLREQNISKARGYLAELQASDSRGHEAIGTLDSQLTQMNQAEQAIKYLIKVHDKLITIPIYAETFKWDWYTLNVDVTNSLSDLRSATEDRKKKINDQLATLPTLIRNLQSNIDLIKATRCGPEGTWNGTMSAPEQSDTPMVLTFSVSGNTYSATASLDNQPATVQNLNVSGTSISFSLLQGGFSLTCSGQISGRSMGGSFRSAQLNGTWTAQRQ